MKKLTVWFIVILAIPILVADCGPSSRRQREVQEQDLAGAWRAKVQFGTGAFAAVKDLEFMYVFNVGGTMTESSNYDAAPPVPPAYGVWWKINDNRFEAKYEFYMTAPPDSAQGAAGSIGWLPAGRGVLLDTITLSDDGKSFASRLRFEAFDRSGNPSDGGGIATGEGTRMEF